MRLKEKMRQLLFAGAPARERGRGLEEAPREVALQVAERALEAEVLVDDRRLFVGLVAVPALGALLLRVLLVVPERAVGHVRGPRRRLRALLGLGRRPRRRRGGLARRRRRPAGRALLGRGVLLGRGRLRGPPALF